MNRIYEVFKSQAELEKSIPKINVIEKENVMDAFQIDNKKVEISYTFILFISMMVIMIFVIAYMIGYVKSESHNLNNILSASAQGKVVVRSEESLTALKKDTMRPESMNSQAVYANKLSDKNIVTNSKRNDYIIELYYGNQMPPDRFLTALKRIVKNIMNIEIDAGYLKRNKNFYIILSSLTTEEEAEKVLELLKLKKMISKTNGKVLVKE